MTQASGPQDLLAPRALPLTGGRVLAFAQAGRRSAIATILAPAGRRRAYLLSAGLHAILRATGPRMLRTALPLDECWPGAPAGELAHAISSELGSFEMMGAALPRQPARERLLLVGRSLGTPVVVKLGTSEGIAREALVLGMLARGLPVARTPPLVGHGTLELPAVGDRRRVEYVAMIALGRRPARPRFTPVHRLEHALGDALGDLPRDGAPAHWVPAHGDLAPWNLRQSAFGADLVDWEHAGWQPPGADAAYFDSSVRFLRGGEPAGPSDDEIAEFWAHRLDRKAAADPEPAPHRPCDDRRERDGALQRFLWRDLVGAERGPS